MERFKGEIDYFILCLLKRCKNDNMFVNFFVLLFLKFLIFNYIYVCKGFNFIYFLGLK